MTPELSGMSALVTAGTSGIGRSLLWHWARLGAQLALSGRDEQRGSHVAREIAAVGGRAEFLPATCATRPPHVLWPGVPPNGQDGVRVNAVSPGPIRTEGTAPMGGALDQLAAPGPAGRPGSPEEIAEVIVFLATSRSSFVHGAIVPVAGGRIAV